MKIDPSNYDYVMYVDASGDDGFQFDNGSSLCYCAAALLVEQEDINHNLDILNQIKSIVGCKLTDEVKYSKVRRHRRSKEALGLLREIKGKMSCHVVFKKELPVENRPDKDKKTLSVVCHAIALRSLDFHQFLDGKNLLIAIDRMKHTEEEPLGFFLEQGKLSDLKNPNRKIKTETVFRDSKDGKFLLIQIADLLCGTVREHFEQYETNSDMIHFSSLCPRCEKLQLIKKGKNRNLCKNKSTRIHNILTSKNFYNILPLFPGAIPFSNVNFLAISPIKMARSHYYMFCLK